MRWIAIFATLALVPALARAEEQEARLKPAAGVDWWRRNAAPVTASVTS